MKEQTIIITPWEQNKERVSVADSVNKKQLIKIQGILTSNLRSRTSSNTPYMAFLRPADSQKHSLEECERTKCQDCEIPVVFRIKDWDNSRLFGEDHWVKPILNKGDQVILEGQWAKSNGNRPSFTCYFYQILEGADK